MQISCTDNLDKEYSFDESEYIDRKGAYGIFKQNNQVLMVQDSISHRWEFPGGGIEKNETIFEGLSREFQEETGLSIQPQITPFKTLIAYHYDLKDHEPWKTERLFFEVIVKDGNLKTAGNNDDVCEAKMIDYSQLQNLSVKGNVAEILHLLKLKN